jgi:hypothetical protein
MYTKKEVDVQISKRRCSPGSNDIFHFFNTSDGIVTSKHHDWMKCTSTFYKDNNKASHFFQLWIFLVIVLLLIPCHPLPAKYVWPYVIESRLNDLYYIVNTPTRRKKTQICQEWMTRNKQ